MVNYLRASQRYIFVLIFSFFILSTNSSLSFAKDHHTQNHLTNCHAAANIFLKAAVPSYAQEKGLFVPAANKQKESVLRRFDDLRSVDSLQKRLPREHVRLLNADDIDVNINLIRKNNTALQELKNIGYKNMSKLAYVTSAAGLWSRGGGVVKALLPYNINELLPEEMMQKLVKAGNIVKAKNNEEIISLADNAYQFSNTRDISLSAHQIKEEQKSFIKEVVESVIYSSHALNPLDMKLVNIALASLHTGQYITFDIWTSDQTHKAVYNYLDWLKKNFAHKTFHEDKQKNEEIQLALKIYLAKSENLGETHLFGYQENFHSIDVESLRWDTNSAPIGHGAGALTAYMDKTGRKLKLQSMGKEYMIFDNIEVITDLPTILGAHVKAKKQVSAVLVTEVDHYTGGKPFMIFNEEDHLWSLELREMSAVDINPELLDAPGQLFNTNTLCLNFQDAIMNVDDITHMGFELKEQNTIARIKFNAGDITFKYKTAAILGRLGEDEMVDFEQFKGINEYQIHGQWYVKIFQQQWTTILQTMNNRPADIAAQI